MLKLIDAPAQVLEAALGDALSYAEQKRTYKLLRAAMAEEGHVVNAFVRESLAKVSGALRDAAGGVEIRAAKADVPEDDADLPEFV